MGLNSHSAPPPPPQSSVTPGSGTLKPHSFTCETKRGWVWIADEAEEHNFLKEMSFYYFDVEEMATPV